MEDSKLLQAKVGGDEFARVFTVKLLEVRDAVCVYQELVCERLLGLHE